MKKIFILTSGVFLGTLFVTSCQQKATNEQVDAKVTELYNEQKAAIENQASIACDSAVNAQVTMIQDSLSHLNAKQQAALLEKTQRELAIAKKKAIAKKPPVVNKTPTAPVKTNKEKEQDRKAANMGSGTNKVEVTAEDTKNKAAGMGNTDIIKKEVTEEDTKNKASRMGGN